MWFLGSENNDRVIYITSGEIVIGRSLDVCNFAIPDDPSISRKHVILTISDDTLLLQDLGSRYGTFINNSSDKVESNTSIKLNNKDIVKFGKMNSIWKVHKVSLITCTSTLKGESLQDLKSVLSTIGGVFKNDWDDTCTYLTMPAITLTVKVVLALAQCSHIVTTEFWNKCVEAVRTSKPLPDPNEYTPHVLESTLNKEVVSFLPNVRRKSLFMGKKFVFFSKRQFEMYKSVLIKSDASPLLLSESKMTVTMLCQEDVIVIQYTPTQTSQETQAQQNQINNIVNHLKNKGKRVVADPEIGLAILYCSTQKYCNPSFGFTSEVVKQNPEQTKSRNVLAQETQEQHSKASEDNGNMIIDESLVVDDKRNITEQIKNCSAKRKLNELSSEFEVNPNKKAAIFSNIASVPNECSKRKLSDEDDCKPSKKQAVNDNCDNDIFSFINENSTDIDKNQNNTKKLNLFKPQKRKIDTDTNDGLFNFVPTDDEGLVNKQSVFSIEKNKDAADTTHIKVETVTPEDVVAMRGVKLKELMESNIAYKNTLEFKVKKKVSELEEQMSGLDLGCTIVVTSNDLIVKKEPIEVAPLNNSVRNFKKFKKVWPLRKQVFVQAPSSISSTA